MTDDEKKSTKKELLEALEQMIQNMENLPMGAMLSPVNHYDLVSVLILFSSLYKLDDEP